MDLRNLKKSRLVFIPLLFLQLFVVGCNDESDCATDSSEIFRIDFYKKVRTSLSSSKENDTLNIKQITTESLGLIYADTLTNSIYLPINPLSDSIHFVLDREKRGMQNITVYYKNISRVISPECGVERVITITEIKSPEIDSITIVNSILQRDDNVNIEIFL